VLDGSSPATRITGTNNSPATRGIGLDPARGRFLTSREVNPAMEVAPLTPGGSLATVGVALPGLENPGGISIAPERAASTGAPRGPPARTATCSVPT